MALYGKTKTKIEHIRLKLLSHRGERAERVPLSRHTAIRLSCAGAAKWAKTFGRKTAIDFAPPSDQVR